VREAARGLKAGEFLLDAVIARAQAMGADPLYLLTNHKCAAAIHLYEKLGFEHDVGIMADYGARYERCDVAMSYRGIGSK
jgi:ribosomal protein S18 acetylase RimI-like enzyme